MKAALFDLDGLLIDSEPIWEEAEISVFNRLGLNVTPAICQKMKGLRVDESIRYVFKLFRVDESADQQQIETEILAKVKHLINSKGKGMPGFVYILHFFKSRGLKIALASSSRMEIINEALNKLGVIQHFDVICSAENEPYGKPHPGIFLSAARALNTEPDECIVFEDSLNGIIAAKAARMKAVLIPDKTLAGDLRVAIADLELNSLLGFKEEHFKNLSDNR